MQLPPPYFKSSAPPELIRDLQQIENLADACYRSLRLLTIPRNVAIWAALTGVIGRAEQLVAQKGYASQAHVSLLQNLSRSVAQIIAWVGRFGSQYFAARRAFRWSASLDSAVNEAIFVAHAYFGFSANYPLWHKNLLLAESPDKQTVRFSIPGDSGTLRVRAYLQGIRPSHLRPSQGLPFQPGMEESVKKSIAGLVRAGSKADGELSFSYGRPKRIWRALYEVHLKSLNALFRRDDRFDLGGYSIGDFKQVYAGLLAVCSLHENACYLRGLKENAYPLDSAVLLDRREQWQRLLSDLTSIQFSKVEMMVKDLTFDDDGLPDVYVHPFVPLSKGADLLGVAPQFVLNSRADENIIRVCSHVRPEVHDVLSLAKEDEMRETLAANCRFGLRVGGPYALPKPLPDIDVVVEDTSDSSVVIAELKWIRKTLRATEHSSRREELVKGIAQMYLAEDERTPGDRWRGL